MGSAWPRPLLSRRLLLGCPQTVTDHPARLTALSFNIHKGIKPVSFALALGQMKLLIEASGADLVFLQEVVGRRKGKVVAQDQFLAAGLWPHVAYGQNAVYSGGHHGNAILSKYPIRSWENQDISPSRVERRGLLHAVVEVPGLLAPLHAICTHLALFENARVTQAVDLCARVRAMVPTDCPLIVAGDFNDWRGRMSKTLAAREGLEEAFLHKHGAHARTFPAWMPALCLDRIYFRGMECERAEVWRGPTGSGPSDHIPLLAGFRFK